MSEPIQSRLGFMQGRLSPQVRGMIQAFPWEHWRTEFGRARQLELTLMEWTLDQDRLRENPLMTREGRREIGLFSDGNGIRVRSLTGDNFMQAPFYKAEGAARDKLVDQLKAVVEACAHVGIRFVLVPLVDNGRIETPQHEEALRAGLDTVTSILRDRGMKIVFESDYPPAALATFMGTFDPAIFGINYDMGNSASLGYDAADELSAYGKLVANVHVKDRLLGGTTVPLGTGNADFPTIFRSLAKLDYQGNFILQTARASDGDHFAALRSYRDMVIAWWADAWT